MPPSQDTSRPGRIRRLLGGVAIVGALAVAGSIATGYYFRAAQATATAAAEPAVSVTVAMIEPLAKRIDPLGWHIQVNASAVQILEHRQLLASLSSPLVIDHMGQIPQPAGVVHPAFGVVEELVARGRTWVKLSGPYLVSRTGAPDYADAGVVARRLAQLAPHRMVWGSDWPHPTQSADNKPDVAGLLEDLMLWIPDDSERYRILVENPASLYGF